MPTGANHYNFCIGRMMMPAYKPKMTHKQRRERRQEIVEAVMEEGLSVEEAAELYEVKVETVKRFIKAQQKIDKEAQAARWKAKRRERYSENGPLSTGLVGAIRIIIALQNTDLNYTQIATLYGVSVQWVCNIARKCIDEGLVFEKRCKERKRTMPVGGVVDVASFIAKGE